MRYLVAYVYILLSGVGVPFTLQARDLIVREYVTLAGEITASWLLEEFFIISSLVFIALLLFKGFVWLPFRMRPRLRRAIDAFSLAMTGFASASLSLTVHAQVYGNTWAPGEAFAARDTGMARDAHRPCRRRLHRCTPR